MADTQTCGNCKWIGSVGDDGYYMECRAHPPVTMNGSLLAKWPRVKREDWCGEWAKGDKP